MSDLNRFNCKYVVSVEHDFPRRFCRRSLRRPSRPGVPEQVGPLHDRDQRHWTSQPEQQHQLLRT
jgi:hypothetical protein